MCHNTNELMCCEIKFKLKIIVLSVIEEKKSFKQRQKKIKTQQNTLTHILTLKDRDKRVILLILNTQNALLSPDYREHPDNKMRSSCFKRFPWNKMSCQCNQIQYYIPEHIRYLLGENSSKTIR